MADDDEKELELKDLIVQTLDANGILSKLKAQIRANVFLALDESDKKSDQKLITIENPIIKNLLTTKEGRLTISLVKEFLEACNLDYTLSVFEPELDAKDDFKFDSKSDLTKELNLLNAKDQDQSALFNLVKSALENKLIKSELIQEIPAEALSKAKVKFDEYDKDKNGVIDRNEMRSLFVDLYPGFNRNMIERYVNDEFSAYDKDLSNGIDFNEFIKFYKKISMICQRSKEDKSDKSDSLNLAKKNSQTSKLIDNNKFKSKISDNDDLSSSSSSTSISEKITKREGVPTPRTNGANAKADKKDSNSDNSDNLFARPADSLFSTRKTDVNSNKPNADSGSSKGGFLNDAPSLFKKPNSKVNALKDLDKELKLGANYDYEESYDEDFTSGTNSRTHSARGEKKKSDKNREPVNEDDVLDNLSYADESSKVIIFLFYFKLNL